MGGRSHEFTDQVAYGPMGSVDTRQLAKDVAMTLCGGTLFLVVYGPTVGTINAESP